MSELITMKIYVITHKVFSNRFVWASSIKSANSFARNIYPTESYSVRESTPQEWDYMHTQQIENAGYEKFITRAQSLPELSTTTQ